jgi:hypothetical protein
VVSFRRASLATFKLGMRRLTLQIDGDSHMFEVPTIDNADAKELVAHLGRAR